MKKDGKYRFSLQFSADTEEQIRAGELLERLGNKKSQIIVAALSEYLTTHPDMESRDYTVKLELTPMYDRNQLEQLITEILKKRIAIDVSDMKNDAVYDEMTNKTSLNDDISAMLDNITLFQS